MFDHRLCTWPGLCVIGLLWTIYSFTLGGGMAQWQMIMDQMQAGS